MTSRTKEMQFFKKSGKFTEEQLIFIEMMLEKEIDMTIFKNLEYYSHDQMYPIILAVEEGLEVDWLIDYNFSPELMIFATNYLRDGINLQKYIVEHNYSLSHLSAIAECKLRGIDTTFIEQEYFSIELVKKKLEESLEEEVYEDIIRNGYALKR